MKNAPRILVIAPHPDDEVLGCGGTIKKYAALGSKVSLCIVTKAYAPEWPERFVRERPKQVARAGKILGVRDVHFLDLPTVKLDTLAQKDINDALSKVISKVRPDVVYIPHRQDINTDHRIVHEAALVACRPVPGQRARRVLAYETLSETEWGFGAFQPSVYEDINASLQAKLKAMRVYESEVKKFPHPRSLEAIEVLAKKRGSEAGVRAAEAFILVREIR